MDDPIDDHCRDEHRHRRNTGRRTLVTDSGNISELSPNRWCYSLRLGSVPHRRTIPICPLSPLATTYAVYVRPRLLSSAHRNTSWMSETPVSSYSYDDLASAQK